MSEPIFLKRKLNLNQLRDEEKRKIAEDLYHSVFSQMWNGVSLEEFYSYFFEGKVYQHRLYLFYCKDKIIGYLIFRVIHTTAQGIDFGIPRISANILPEYMGHKLTTIPVFKECLVYYLKNLLHCRRMVLIITANTPSSYVALHNRTRRIYPSPNHKTPYLLVKLVESLSESINIKIDPNYPFLCQYKGVGMKPNLSKNLDNTAGYIADFYRRQCPNYQQGSALITIMPVNIFSGILEIVNQLRLLCLGAFSLIKSYAQRDKKTGNTA